MPTRVGAAAVTESGRRIIGWNKRKTHPKLGESFRSIHAETDALIKAQRYGERITEMMVVRVTRDGLIADSVPCKLCRPLLSDICIRCYKNGRLSGV